MREASLGLLTGYLGAIVDAIVGSAGRCPAVMRLAFKQLHQRVEERFPQTEHKVGRWGDRGCGGQQLVQGCAESGQRGDRTRLPTLKACVSGRSGGGVLCRVWDPGEIIIVNKNNNRGS